MKFIICLFKGHIPVTRKRAKEINHAIQMYGWDAWGSNAFDNMKKMDALEKELVSCTRCRQKLD